jgi:hypothetical protein
MNKALLVTRQDAITFLSTPRLRAALPAWVTNPVWGENVGWKQPRLLSQPLFQLQPI